MAKYPQWEYDLLRYLGTPAPLTNEGMDAQFPNSLLALNLWAQSEGSVTNNALATSGKGPGATTCVAQCGSSSPIYEYDNVADGVAQMGRFLQGSFYSKIVSSLVGNASLSDIYHAINSSKWCQGCQGGKYPTALATAVGGGASGISGTVGTGSGGTAGSGSGSNGSSKCGANPVAGDLCQCVISLPGFLFFSGPCLLTRGGVKWLSGAAALIAGVGLAGFGIVLLASSGFGSPGAKQAVGKVAKTAGLSASLFAGPEVAGGVKAASVVKKAPANKAAAPARQAPARAASEPRTAGRLESRQIERRYQQAQRDQGPIGPRGGNPTANRIAQRERRGTSVPGAREAQRRRAQQPF